MKQMGLIRKAILRAALPAEARDALTEIGDVSTYLQWLQEHSGKSASGATVTESSMLTLSYAYSCINVLSETTAHVPLHLLRKEAKGNVKATDHPLYSLMHDQPHRDHTSFTFRQTLEAHRNGWGNCYAWIKRPNPLSDQVDQIQILYPDRTHPRRLKDGSLVYETTLEDNTKEIIPAIDIIHVHGMGFNGLTGYSPVQKLKEAFGLGLATQEFGNSFFGSGANPRMIIESEGQTANAESFREQLQKNFAGLHNANKTLVLPKGAKASTLTINPDDAQFLQTRQFNRTEVAGIYRVPPHFIGDLDKNTFTNAAHMDLSFVKHSMVPIFVRWEAELNRKLLTKDEIRDGYFFQFNVNGILRGSPEERAAYYQRGIQDGWMHRNEPRSFEDLPIDEERLNQFLIPVNMQTIDAAEAGPQQPSQNSLSINLQPMLESLSFRISKYARKGLKENINSPENMIKFVQTHRDLVKNIVLPLVQSLGQEEKRADQFADQYIEKLQRVELDPQKIDESLSQEKISEQLSEVVTDEN